jgi:ankyrin repeat protein
LKLVAPQQDFQLVVGHTGGKPIHLSTYNLQITIKSKDEKGNAVGGSELEYQNASLAKQLTSSVNQSLSHFTSQQELTNGSEVTLSFRLLAAPEAKRISIVARLQYPGKPLQQVKLVWQVSPKDQITQHLFDLLSAHNAEGQAIQERLNQAGENSIRLTSDEWEMLRKYDASKDLFPLLEKLKNGEQLTEERQQDAAHSAAAFGNISILKVLLENIPDFDVAKPNEHGITVLSSASAPEVVEWLIKQGCDVNQRDNSSYTSFQRAVMANNIEAVKYMAAHGADINDDLAKQKGVPRTLTMHSAVSNTNNPGMVKTLLDLGVPATGKTDQGSTILHCGAANGGKELGELLLQLIPESINDKNNQGETSLHLAAWGGNEEMVKLLLSMLGIQISEKDRQGNTPLSIAAARGKIGVVRLLLDVPGININQQNTAEGYTALHTAINQGHPDIAKLFILNPATNVNIQDHDGNTPLHFAAAAPDLSTLTLLLKRNDIALNTTNRMSKTALELAQDNNNQAAIDLFAKRQAGTL